MASSAVVLMAVSFMPRLRTAWRTMVLNGCSTLLVYQSGPKFLMSFTESVTCSTETAWKVTGTPSEVMVSSMMVSNFAGCMLTSMPRVVIAVNVLPVCTGVSTTPPCPKNQGFLINTTSCPASGP